MNVISIIQPWAELIVIGAKHYETRTWSTNARGRILIHASGKRDKDFERISQSGHFKTFLTGDHAYKYLSFGAIIGEATIEGVYACDVARNHITETESVFGDWRTGHYAWQMVKPIKYRTAYPVKGQLSIWDFPEELLMHCK